MPEAMFLHIKTRDAAAPRVLELSGENVRVGRAPHCEVRLTDPALADVQCLLRRRGLSWYLIPLGPPGRLFLDGRPADHQRPLPVGASLRVGDAWLTLQSGRHFQTVEGQPAVMPAEPAAPILGFHQLEPPEAKSAGRTSSAAREGAFWKSRLEAREKFLKDRERFRRWQELWKATEHQRRKRPVEVEPPASSAPWPGASRIEPPLTPAAPIDPVPIHPRRPYEREGWDQPNADRTPGEPAGSAPIAAEPVAPDDAAATEAEPDRIQAWQAWPELREASFDETTPRAEVGGIVEEPGSPPEQGSACDGPVAGPDVEEGLSVERGPDVEEGPGDLDEPPPPEASRPREEAERPQPAATDAHEQEEPEPVTVETLAEEWPRSFVADTASRSWPTPPPAGGGREREANEGVRGASGPSAPLPPGRAAAPPEEVFWPSAKVVLAASASARATGTAPVGARKPTRAVGRRVLPEPTHGEAPRGWTIRSRLAGLPLLVLALGFACGANWLAWTWGKDDRASGVLADRLASVGSSPRLPRFDDLEPPAAPSWWASTGLHMYLWAAAAGLDEDRPDRAGAARDLLDRAVSASPLEPAARIARADSLANGLGLSRDVAARRVSGRLLLAAGRREAGLNAYRGALEAIARTDPSRAAVPGFVEDPRVRRFLLPHEDEMVPLLRDLQELLGEDAAAWSAALPASSLAALAAFRLLRERGGDGTRLAERILADDGSTSVEPAAVRAAARAEVLALLERHAEAIAAYREAIALCPPGPIGRTWSFNLGSVAARGGDTEAQRTAWASARGPDLQDAVNRRLREAWAESPAGGAVAGRPAPRDGAVGRAGAERNVNQPIPN